MNVAIWLIPDVVLRIAVRHLVEGMSVPINDLRLVERVVEILLRSWVRTVVQIILMDHWMMVHLGSTEGSEWAKTVLLRSGVLEGWKRRAT